MKCMFGLRFNLKDDLLGLHLIKNVVAFHCIRQWHEFIEHEPTSISSSVRPHIAQKLTQVDAVSALAISKPLGKLTVQGIDPSEFSNSYRTPHFHSMVSINISIKFNRCLSSYLNLLLHCVHQSN